MIASAIELFRDCKAQIDSSGVFSSNEDVDDISTGDLCLLAFVLGTCCALLSVEFVVVCKQATCATS